MSNGRMKTKASKNGKDILHIVDIYSRPNKPEEMEVKLFCDLDQNNIC